MSNILEVADIAVHFGGLRALDGVTLELRQGEILGLIGPNGAGKTTLFEVITGFQRPSVGEVRLRGENVTNTPPARMNQLGVGRTFQFMELFMDMSAHENAMVGGLVSTGDLGEAADRADRMLELVGLTPKREAPAGTLSTGQRKRLEMARAMASDPDVLLLDEVFGGLDVASSDSLLEVIRNLHGSTSVSIVIIDHNLELLMRLVDRVVALAAGRVIAEGDPHEVANDPDVVEAYIR